MTDRKDVQPTLKETYAPVKKKKAVPAPAPKKAVKKATKKK